MQAGGGCLVGNVLEAEVALGVVVADVGYHLSDEGHLAFGQQSGLHIAANHAAEAAAEVFLSLLISAQMTTSTPTAQTEITISYI